MQWKRAIGLLFCSFLLAAALTGCRPTSSRLDAPASKYNGMELQIACPSEVMAALIESHARAWAHNQGVKITVQLYDPTNQEPSKNQPSSSADVWILLPADLPRWAAADQLVPLPASYNAMDNPLAWSDFLPTFREQLTKWDTQAYGVPVVGEAPLCCYRSDLLKAPAHQSALRKLFGRNLERPTTWEQFAQLAEYFHTQGVQGKPGPSLPPLPRAEADLDRLFCTIAAGFARRALRIDEPRNAYQQTDLFSFHYDFKTGEPRVAEPGFVYALKWMQRLQACRPAEPVDHPEEAFRAGQAVLCLTDAPWLKAFQKTPALHDKFSVCRIPGGEHYFDIQTGKAQQPKYGSVNWVPYLGGAGWLGVVPRSSRNVEAAFDLLTDLSGTKTSLQIFLGAKGSGGPTRTSQLYRHRWDSFDLDDQRATQLRDSLEETLLHRNLKNPALCLRTPRQAAHRAILVRGLREALLKGDDAEKTLKQVAEEWRKLDREQGLPEHRADYRRSLGLLAKE